MVGEAVNQGRDEVFADNESDIHALQRSEILDGTTCNYCLSMDGRIIDVKDKMAKAGIFHGYCRGIWVEIMKDEEDKPKVSGIPNSLRDKYGDGVNELTQPTNPIVKKDSLANKFIRR
jgi:hypothetical protein